MAHPSGSSRWRRGLTAAGIAAGVLAATTGCSAREILFIGLPEPATEEAEITEALWEGAWVAAWPVGILVWALLILAVIFYSRRNRKELPEQVRYNLPIEVLYTVAPLIMIFGLFWFTARDQADILELSDDPDQTISVVGFQWSWGFNYTDDDVYDVGTPQDFPTLVLPVDETVRFELNSPDVIHSFWVPDWLFKMDVIPGKQNQFEVTPNKEGEFAGKCAELCGVDHSRMLFTVRVVPRAEYDAHIQELRSKGQTGELDTGRANREGEVEGVPLT